MKIVIPNPMTKIRKMSVGLKALLPSEMRFPGQAAVFFDLLRPTENDMARDVGDGTSSDVLMTPIRWLQRAIVEAPFVSLDPDGEPLEKSDLTALLNKPNPFYSLEVLLQGTVLSLSMDGNAYWIVTRSTSGRPVELWYTPHMNIEPKWKNGRGELFISHYEYDVGGAGKERLELENVIHFRDGIDPSNLREGLSKLKGLLREIWTDNEAAKFTSALLKNNAIPGLVISPDDTEVQLTVEEGEAIEEKVKAKTTGDGRGKTLVMLGKTKVDQFGFSPQQMDLSSLRNMSEERVTASLGVQAAVVGFGSGLQQTKVGATMRELRQLSWTNGVIPLQRIIAGEVGRALGEVFNVDSVEFDNRNVQALRENEDTKAARVGRLYRDGVVLRSEARKAMGFESVPADDVYISNLANVFIPQGQVVEVSGNGDAPKAARKTYADLTDEEQRAWYPWMFKQNAAPPAEQRIIAAAPSAPPVPGGEELADELNTIRERAPEIFQSRLERVFENLGDSAEEAARLALGEVELAADSGHVEMKQGVTISEDELADDLRKRDAHLSTLREIGELCHAHEFFKAVKQGGELTPEDIALLATIFDAIDVAAAQAELQAALEVGYTAIAGEAFSVMRTSTLAQAAGGDGGDIGIDIAFTLDDAAQQRVLQNAGVRAGLIDLDAQTRDALFDALAEGRADGLAGDALARRIRERIEAGPWRDVETRARVIARTEGAHAANMSTLEAARAMPETEHVQIFDDRLGDGDEQCSTANTRIVTIPEAEAIGLCHPNGTRAFVPVNAVLMEEILEAQRAEAEAMMAAAGR